MRNRLSLVIAAGVTLSLGVVGFAHAEPGPNGHNNRGLCTAYFNGSPTGQANKRKAGPFVALEEAADDGDSSTPAADDVAAFCEGMVGGAAGR